MNLPPVVSPAEWQVARDELLAKEKDVGCGGCSMFVDNLGHRRHDEYDA
jgi:predicted dithiol-disulfide oxidoreductase (DUF899 family)